jgi:hypothetical protein
MTRSDRDAYWTPAERTRDLLDAVPEIGGVVWEPCAGAGWMVDVLRDDPRVTAVLASDIHPMREDIVRGGALSYRPRGWINWIITNPPYDGRSIGILDRALTIAPRVALLVPLTWLEGTRARLPVFRAHPPARVLVMPRTEFPRADGQPQRNGPPFAPCWCVWGVEPEPIHWVVFGEQTTLFG